MCSRCIPVENGFKTIEKLKFESKRIDTAKCYVLA
jgi:hypothetical protein